MQGGAAAALATRDSEAPVAVGDATPTIQPDASLPQRGAASPDEMGSMNQGQNVAPGSQLSSLQVVAQPSVIEVGIPEWVDVTEAPPLPDEVLESLEPEDLPPPGQPGFDPNESPFCR